jgi:hypothetical protein
MDALFTVYVRTFLSRLTWTDNYYFISYALDFDNTGACAQSGRLRPIISSSEGPRFVSCCLVWQLLLFSASVVKPIVHLVHAV